MAIKILIVEDEQIVSRMYQKILSFAGFDVIIAMNGQDGIEKAKTERPELILLDIMMPNMNGIEALTALKKDPEVRNIPVVMLTNLSGTHDEKLAYSKGATGYWVKSDVDAKSMPDKIKQILRK